MDQKLKEKLIAESSFPLAMAALLEGPEEAEKLISAAQKAFDVRVSKLSSIIGGLPAGGYKDVLSKFTSALDSATDETDSAMDDPEGDAEKVAAGAASTLETLNHQVRQIL